MTDKVQKIREDSNPYQKVLKRFKAQKGEKA